MIRRIGYYKNKTFKILSSIDEDEEKNIYKFLLDLGNYYKDTLLYTLVDRNYSELVTAIKHYTKEINDVSNIKAKTDEFYDEVLLELNRLVLNFLTVFRTYLDHNETRIKHEFGKSSIEINEFKLATKSEFDSNFTYRFFYKFRNYSQHCGIPIASVTTKLGKDNKGEENIQLLFELDSNELLSVFDWGSDVKNDLISINGKFDLINLIYQFDGALNRIQEKIISIREKKLKNAFQQYLSYCYSPDIGYISVYILHSNSEEEYRNGKFTLHPISLPNVNYINELKKLGVNDLNIELKPFMQKVIKDIMN